MCVCVCVCVRVRVCVCGVYLCIVVLPLLATVPTRAADPSGNIYVTIMPKLLSS